MGLFSSASPFDKCVERATDEKNVTENWGHIMEVVDKCSSTSNSSKDCLRAIVKRIQSEVPNIAMQALTVLDACVSNCGKPFLLEVASRDFEIESRKIIIKAHKKVSEKLKMLIKKWAENEFKSDPQLTLIPSLHRKLMSDAYDTMDSPKKATQSSRSIGQSQKEEDDLAKAIQLSLSESEKASASRQENPSSDSIYPTNYDTTEVKKDLRKVRALYDFEAAEDNELTFYAGEIVHVIDDSDSNWWKGSNQRGSGLFPANFVTADLNAEIEQFKTEGQQKKSVQFNDEVEIKTVERIDVEPAKISEEIIEEWMCCLHEADPTGERQDPPQLQQLEEQCNGMGPLIDQELEKIDRKHAQLSKINADLVAGLNMYHSLMKQAPIYHSQKFMNDVSYVQHPQYQPPQQYSVYQPASTTGYSAPMFQPPTSMYIAADQQGILTSNEQYTSSPEQSQSQQQYT